ncbi:hypothetical protein [Paenibacillus sp. J22TS3]|uniref:hypothetical protein n=1 Tax=Paenibacillus sp. J22TS3 TaxID=2807192 RepID=UPI001B21D1E0|nr:hypothetical protein [Paenibacillus sp. J22TS3]GIP23804.1 hypothetical protein J22TS3_40790 [Paenibacillus sp. J22TS3]
MARKQCLFCDGIVSIVTEGEYDRFVSCHCSPTGDYLLERGSYNSIQALPYQDKRQILHVVSAYIREMSGAGKKVRITAEGLNDIMNSPEIPVTIEDKAGRLLLYLYKNSGAPDDPVVIRPLSHSFNLTYSPNLQELVFIIDRLVSEGSISREGGTFKLTAKGWKEAEARAGGRKLKSCSVIMPEGGLTVDWQEKVLPRLEQCGYQPHIWREEVDASLDISPVELIHERQLVVADVTKPSPDVYYAAGIAAGSKVPVIWTARQSEYEPLPAHANHIRPLVYQSAEDLAEKLQQKLLSL